MKRNTLYVLAVALVAAGLFVAAREHRASAAGLPELLDLAPADSTMIAYADVAGLRDSPLTERLGAWTQPSQVDRDYADFVAGTGFDYQKDLDRLLVVSEPSASAASPASLIVAEGRFNRQKIEQYALRSGKLEQKNGREFFIVPSAATGKNIEFTFLASDRLALASGADLSAILSPKSPTSIDPGMRERLSRISGAPLFAEVKASSWNSAIGSGNANGAPGGPKISGLAGPLSAVRWIGLAARPDGDDILFSAEGECDRPEDAQSVASAIGFLRVVLRGALNDPKSRGQMPAASAAAAARLLDTLKVTTDAARVRLTVSLTPDMLQLPSPSAR